MRLLDLFCGAGGAAMGYHRAGFEVVGVDSNPQPHYPFKIHQADATTFPLYGFDVIHASPPCQALTPMSNRWRGRGTLADERVNLIGVMQERLRDSGKPYVIENVPGSKQHLDDPIVLQGGQFGLKVWRPRYFECSPRIPVPPKAPRPFPAVAIYGRPRKGEDDHRWLWKRTDGSRLLVATEDEAREAMGMQWADWYEISQAIPPAYTEWIGTQLLKLLT